MSPIIYTTALLSLFSLLPSALAAAPSAGTTYVVSPSGNTDLCIAPRDDWEGSKLVLKDCDEDDTAWEWTGSQFKNTATNLCVDMTDGGRWSGNKMQVWSCYDYNTNQQYATDGAMIHWDNFCWDLTDGQHEIGTVVQIWSCFNYNSNQQWTFTEVEEVDDCDDDSTTDTSDASTTLALTDIIPTATASVTGSALGEGLWATNGGASGKHRHSSTTSAGWSESTATTDSWSNATSSGSLVNATASATTAFGTATATLTSASAAATTKSSGGTTSSGYLQTSGNKIVDSNGNTVVLRGTNIGGWLVWEDWMCGISDSQSPDRFPMTTLTNRFGNDKAMTLWETWISNWLTEKDFDYFQEVGFNVVRLPFTFRSVQNADGSWRDDAFTHMDWAVNQAKSRGIYVIIDFHIWAGQEASYSAISENNSEGQNQRNAAGEIWKKVAAHYLGESIIAGFDIINEPTGSWGDLLQQDLYKAVRSVDANRIIIHESISTNPANYGWTNVVYSLHEYNMMGSDLGSNKQQWASGVQQYIDLWSGYGIPTMLGEFMADGETLSYMLEKSNEQGLSWLTWAHSTVNMGRWGLWNHDDSMRVSVDNDSYDSIKNAWSNMPTISKSNIIYDQLKSAAGGSTNLKRDISGPTNVNSPRAERTKRLVTARHGGRSRRAVAHGSNGNSY
ncbi:hypothetical protein CI109_105041 [Kwoniella shandongensis]|uniref:Uncharacterized protein n=1 Tax=Kwoniella shandongensis TaxID=1734106 RepID=A0A5M6BYK2_9TREE|nr:uncharacterized protein CI109_004360 [Kwoniella shandongensis]KAA5527300.1 hypothetical protein CI109_004360 [Kwoniella shandongensis]